MLSLDGVKILKNVLSDPFWRHLATKLWARSLRSMAEYEASRRDYKFDPVKILPKPHRFGAAPAPKVRSDRFGLRTSLLPKAPPARKGP